MQQNPKIPTSRLKRYSSRRLELTRDYCSGVTAGFGLGIVTMACVVRSGWTWLIIPGFVLISIGSFIARSAHAAGIPVSSVEASIGDQDIR